VRIVVPRNSGLLNISWLAPSQIGSGVTNYTARAWSARTGGSIISSCTSSTTSCQISGLLRKTNYSIDVIATGPGGTSSPSSPRTNTTTY
jgi:hypothetical protein